MKSMGFDQGRRGLVKLTEEIRKTCVTSSKTVDLEKYEIGFNMGWSEYCTPLNGFDIGRRGDIYKSFCPVDKEDLFHEKFLIGKQVYEKKDRVSDIESKIKDLTMASEHDLAAKDELNRMKDYLLTLNREIQSLEQQGLNPAHDAR